CQARRRPAGAPAIPGLTHAQHLFGENEKIPVQEPEVQYQYPGAAQLLQTAQELGEWRGARHQQEDGHAEKRASRKGHKPGPVESVCPGGSDPGQQHKRQDHQGPPYNVSQRDLRSTYQNGRHESVDEQDNVIAAGHQKERRYEGKISKNFRARFQDMQGRIEISITIYKIVPHSLLLFPRIKRPRKYADPIAPAISVSARRNSR